MKHILFSAPLAAALVTTALAENYKMTTLIAPGVATPDNPGQV